jgi:hypothetical protein
MMKVKVKRSKCEKVHLHPVEGPMKEESPGAGMEFLPPKM